MIKSFSEHILKKDEKALQKSIKNSFKTKFIDDYEAWIYENLNMDPKKIIEKQAGYMQSIFKPILEENF